MAAKVHMGHAWADGSRIWLTVVPDNGSPEALLQARLVATDAFAEMMNSISGDVEFPDELLADAAAEYGIDMTEGD